MWSRSKVRDQPPEIRTSETKTPLHHISHPERKVNGERWRQLERARAELMRGNKIHSSLQFQGWRSWDLRKGPESRRRREILNERHYGRRKPHYTICPLPAGASREKNPKHVLSVHGRCEFLKRAEISTPWVSLIATVCKDLAALWFGAIHRSITDIHSESKRLLNIPFKVGFNNMMSLLPL